jgi:hypothetical protein
VPFSLPVIRGLPLFPHFSPQVYYRLPPRFVNTFWLVFLNFLTNFVSEVEKGVVLHTNYVLPGYLGAKVIGKVETFFCGCPHGKILVLEVFVEGFHAY